MIFPKYKKGFTFTHVNVLLAVAALMKHSLTRGRNPLQPTRGFTLLEMSVVLALIGFIAAGAMVTLTAAVQSSQYNATVATMQAIEAALANYRNAFNRIPCPAQLIGITPSSTNYGVEAANPGTCTGGTPAADFSGAGMVEGAVPTRALQMPDSYMYDGWGNHIRYAVSASMTATGAFTTTPANCAGGTITVNDAAGAARTTAAVYALISHGANGHGAYTRNAVTINAGSTNTDEQANCSCDSSGAHTGGAGVFTPTLVQKLPVLTSGSLTNNFDDIVSFKERWQMLTAWDAGNASTPNTGYVYVVDTHNHRIRKISLATGIITTVAGNGTAGYSGDGGLATSAAIGTPTGVAVDSSGNFYISDMTGYVRKVTAGCGGIISTVAGNATSGYSGDGGPAIGARMSEPWDVAVDSAGNLYIADTYNYVIRKVTAATGIISLFAGTPGTRGSAGDGGLATSAQLASPLGVAVDSAGNIYIADAPAGNKIRKVTAATGIITTVAGVGSGNSSGDGGPATSASIPQPQSVAVDSAGNLYIVDEGGYIRKVTAATGIITTVAGNGTYGYSGDGGAATSAAFSVALNAVAVDSSTGDFYIADNGNNRIRKVTAATGIISTIAGNSTASFSGDGGLATSATVNLPQGIAFSNR